MGIISAIGHSVSENHNSLINNLSGISLSDNFPSKYSGILPLAQVSLTNEDLKEKLNITDAGITRTSLLAHYAFKKALNDANLSHQDLVSPKTALVGGTTVGGMSLTDELYRDSKGNGTDKTFLSSYDFASVFLSIQHHYKMMGIVNTINTACSSSANAIMYGCRLIKNGFANKVIVGGADSLSKFTINGFNALRILSNENCIPFDKNRKGLNLGEGAAFLVLEKEEDALNKKVYAEISGYYNSNDSFHPSSLSEQGDGPFLCMEGALKLAKLNPNQIDFINAHGTGTENNDESESRAMINLFKNVPDFASTKSYTGHTLGAASALEAVYSILNIKYQEVYKNIGFENAIEVTGLIPILSNKKTSINHVMSNSFGFGGNCTSLIFSKL